MPSSSKVRPSPVPRAPTRRALLPRELALTHSTCFVRRILRRPLLSLYPPAVTKLNTVRDEASAGELSVSHPTASSSSSANGSDHGHGGSSGGGGGGGRQDEDSPSNSPNRVDQTLSDVFSLVSLFFLTVRPTSDLSAPSSSGRRARRHLARSAHARAHTSSRG